jgi:rfaE bifunctional protein nucleotidyltransferase chain/domain
MKEKIVTLKEAAKRANEFRKAGKTVALANGSFDLLHVGHVRYLLAAAETADILVAAVNSDASVRGYKGPQRPVMPEDERAEIVAAITGVDLVVIFEEETVERVIRELRPDIQCKGTDYTEASVPEGDLVRSLGGRVMIVGDPKDHDSSSIIASIARTLQ